MDPTRMDSVGLKPKGIQYFSDIIMGVFVSASTIFDWWCQRVPRDMKDYLASQEELFLNSRSAGVEELISDREMLGFGLSEEMNEVSLADATLWDLANPGTIELTPPAGACSSAPPILDKSDCPVTPAAIPHKDGRPLHPVKFSWSNPVGVTDDYEVQGPLSFPTLDSLSEMEVYGVWTTEEARRRVALGNAIDTGAKVGEPTKWFTFDDVRFTFNN